MLNISIVHPVLGKLGSIFTSVSWNRAVIYVTELCDSWTAAAARWSAIPAPSGKRKKLPPPVLTTTGIQWPLNNSIFWA